MKSYSSFQDMHVSAGSLLELEVVFKISIPEDIFLTSDMLNKAKAAFEISLRNDLGIK